MRQTTRGQKRLPLPITPRGGAVGSAVSLRATGLPPNVTLLIAFANLQNYQLIQRVITDAEGTFTAVSQVPRWAVLDGAHYFFASFADEIPLAFSEAFHVTDGDGTARVTGTIANVAGTCVDLRDEKDVLYHLTGKVGERRVGERVVATGTVGDSDACGTGVVITATGVTAL